MVVIAFLALFLSAFTYTQEKPVLTCIDAKWNAAAKLVNMVNTDKIPRRTIPEILNLKSDDLIHNKALTELKKWYLNEEGVWYIAKNPSTGYPEPSLKIIRGLSTLPRKKITPEDFFKGSSDVNEQLELLENSLKTNTPLLVPFRKIYTCIKNAENAHEKEVCTNDHTGNDLKKRLATVTLHYALLNDKQNLVSGIIKEVPEALATMLDLYGSEHNYRFAQQLYTNCFKQTMYPISTGCLQWIVDPKKIESQTLEEKDTIANVVRETIQEMGRRQAPITKQEARLLTATETVLIEQCSSLTQAYFFNTMGMAHQDVNYFEKTIALFKNHPNLSIQEQVAYQAALRYTSTKGSSLISLFKKMEQSLSASEIDHCVRATCLIDSFITAPDLLEEGIKSYEASKHKDVSLGDIKNEYKKSLEVYRAYYSAIYESSKKIDTNNDHAVALKNEAITEIITCEKRLLAILPATQIEHYLKEVTLAIFCAENTLLAQAEQHLFDLEKKIDILTRLDKKHSGVATSAKILLDAARRKVTVMKNKTEQSK
jgi:hypothetical protein